MSSIPLTGTGGLFARIGAMGGLASAVNADRSSVVPYHIGEIQQQFTFSNQDVIDNIYSYLSSYQNAGNGIMSNVRSLARSTVQEMANDSVPLASQATKAAMSLLVSQMAAEGQSVRACSVSASAYPYPTNAGNAVAAVSCKDANGYNTEYMFSELATASIAMDYQSSRYVLGSEPIAVSTPASVSDSLSWAYPAGSGVSGSYSAISALLSGRSGTSNWLNNGAMESYSASANLPDYWHVGTGTPGSTILRATGGTLFYDGSSSISFVGDGSEQTAIYQAFSVAASSFDTPAIIYPNGQFCVNFAVRVSSTPPSGVLQASLSSPAGVSLDNAGNPNVLSIDLASLGASWSIYNAFFRTPNKMPVPIYLQFALTTPLPSGYTLYIDHVSFAQVYPLYPGGPSLAFFSGNVASVQGDSFAIRLSNDYGGKMQYLFDQLFNMKSMGMILPSNATGGETIPDSLIA